MHSFPTRRSSELLRAMHAELAGKAEHLRHLVERRGAPKVEVREHVHHVHVARVIAVEIIVEFVLALPIALLPVLRGVYTVQQGPIREHRQIESTAAPGYQYRLVTIQSVVKALDQ